MWLQGTHYRKDSKIRRCVHLKKNWKGFMVALDDHWESIQKLTLAESQSNSWDLDRLSISTINKKHGYKCRLEKKPSRKSETWRTWKMSLSSNKDITFVSIQILMTHYLNCPIYQSCTSNPSDSYVDYVSCSYSSE